MASWSGARTGGQPGGQPGVPTQLLRARLSLDSCLASAKSSSAAWAAAELSLIIGEVATTNNWLWPRDHSELQLLDDAFDSLCAACTLLDTACRELRRTRQGMGVVKPQKLTNIRGRVRVHLAAVTRHFYHAKLTVSEAAPTQSVPAGAWGAQEPVYYSDRDQPPSSPSAQAAARAAQNNTNLAMKNTKNQPVRLTYVVVRVPALAGRICAPVGIFEVVSAPPTSSGYGGSASGGVDGRGASTGLANGDGPAAAAAGGSAAGYTKGYNHMMGYNNPKGAQLSAAYGGQLNGRSRSRGGGGSSIGGMDERGSTGVEGGTDEEDPGGAAGGDPGAWLDEQADLAEMLDDESSDDDASGEQMPRRSASSKPMTNVPSSSIHLKAKEREANAASRRSSYPAPAYAAYEDPSLSASATELHASGYTHYKTGSWETCLGPERDVSGRLYECTVATTSVSEPRRVMFRPPSHAMQRGSTNTVDEGLNVHIRYIGEDTQVLYVDVDVQHSGVSSASNATLAGLRKSSSTAVVHRSRPASPSPSSMGSRSGSRPASTSGTAGGQGLPQSSVPAVILRPSTPVSFGHLRARPGSGRPGSGPPRGTTHHEPAYGRAGGGAGGSRSDSLQRAAIGRGGVASATVGDGLQAEVSVEDRQRSVEARDVPFNRSLGSRSHKDSVLSASPIFGGVKDQRRRQEALRLQPSAKQAAALGYSLPGSSKPPPRAGGPAHGAASRPKTPAGAVHGKGAPSSATSHSALFSSNSNSSITLSRPNTAPHTHTGSGYGAAMASYSSSYGVSEPGRMQFSFAPVREQQLQQRQRPSTGGGLTPSSSMPSVLISLSGARGTPGRAIPASRALIKTASVDDLAADLSRTLPQGVQDALAEGSYCDTTPGSATKDRRLAAVYGAAHVRSTREDYGADPALPRITSEAHFSAAAAEEAQVVEREDSAKKHRQFFASQAEAELDRLSGSKRGEDMAEQQAERHSKKEADAAEALRRDELAKHEARAGARRDHNIAFYDSMVGVRDRDGEREVMKFGSSQEVRSLLRDWLHTTKTAGVVPEQKGVGETDSAPSGQPVDAGVEGSYEEQWQKDQLKAIVAEQRKDRARLKAVTSGNKPATTTAQDNEATLIKLHFRCEKLKSHDYFSKSDPFIVLFVDGCEVGRTEIAKNKASEDFHTPITCTYKPLQEQKARIEVRDDDGGHGKKFNLIGVPVETTVGELVVSHEEAMPFVLVNAKGKAEGNIFVTVVDEVEGGSSGGVTKANNAAGEVAEGKLAAAGKPGGRLRPTPQEPAQEQLRSPPKHEAGGGASPAAAAAKAAAASPAASPPAAAKAAAASPAAARNKKGASPQNKPGFSSLRLSIDRADFLPFVYYDPNDANTGAKARNKEAFVKVYYHGRELITTPAAATQSSSKRQAKWSFGPKEVKLTGLTLSGKVDDAHHDQQHHESDDRVNALKFVVHDADSWAKRTPLGICACVLDDLSPAKEDDFFSQPTPTFSLPLLPYATNGHDTSMLQLVMASRRAVEQSSEGNNAQPNDTMMLHLKVEPL